MKYIKNILILSTAMIICLCGCNITSTTNITTESLQESVVETDSESTNDDSEISFFEESYNTTSELSETSTESSYERYESSKQTEISSISYDKSERKSENKYTFKNKTADYAKSNTAVIECKDITSSTNIFKKTILKYWEMSNFKKSKTAGCGLDDKFRNKPNKYANNPENVTYSEGYYGIKATISNNRYLNVRAYSHLNDVKCELIDIVYEEPNAVSLPLLGTNQVRRADLWDEHFISGLYAIHAEFKIKSDIQMCNLYLFVDCYSNDSKDYHFYLCEGRSCDDSSGKDTATLKAELQKQIKEAGYTPENCLNPKIAYPYETNTKNNYDTPFWINKAHEIIKGYEYESNEFKALLLHDWMTENLVYDKYIANKKLNTRYYNDYTSGKNYVSNIKVGVCRDFSNIYAIMCREVNIPCLLCSNNEIMHMWNAVYLDGTWKMIDLSEDVERKNMTKEIKMPYADNENTHCFQYYLVYINDGYGVDVFNRHLRYYQ